MAIGVFHGLLAGSACGQMGGQPTPAIPGLEKPKFYEKVMQEGGPRVRETDGRIVKEVRLVGLRVVSEDRVYLRLRTRADRDFSKQVVIEDVRSLYQMEYFSRVTHEITETPEGVIVTFTVQERELITDIVYHGNYALSDRELKGQAGLQAGDPINDQRIENTRRQIESFYHEQGFLNVAVEAQVGMPESPRTVVFRINEGPKIRVDRVHVEGNQFIDEARLKKIVTARGGWLGLPRYFGNTASKTLFEDDIERLKLYYRNLGFFEATAGYKLAWDPSGKWLDVVYVIHEGPRYHVVDSQILGANYITEDSLSLRLKLKPGQAFDRGKMDADVRTLRDAYGEQGFFFADIQAQPTLLDEPGKLAMVYRISEGDRCKAGEIRIHINGDSLHTRVNPIYNRLDGILPGQLLNRRKVEQSERRLMASGLFETNPAEGDRPRIEVATPKFEDAFY